MRRLVGTPAAGEDGPLAPATTIDDLRSLAARSTAVGLPVQLHLDGLDEDAGRGGAVDLPGGRRGDHQRTAPRNGRDPRGRPRSPPTTASSTVVVDDDGAATRSPRPGGPGYGLIGMAERTEALGGRFEAGPGRRRRLAHRGAAAR